MRVGLTELRAAGRPGGAEIGCGFGGEYVG
jgi:hypothetical protein